MTAVHPTGVGNASDRKVVKADFTVHPHGCGERTFVLCGHKAISGSSPRVWGTPNLSHSANDSSSVHPHGCGEREVMARNGYSTVRFIPTGVGNAIPINLIMAGLAVHPHGCGERIFDGFLGAGNHGSSPRVWGTLLRPELYDHSVLVHPTGVGNAAAKVNTVWAVTVHPHGCGERFRHRNMIDNLSGSSPRVWGTPHNALWALTVKRFIPTGVGNA